MPDSMAHAVFLSYASQDAEAVLRIAEALRSAGVEVWFDQDELVGGDAWDAKIRKQIAECALFVPVISAATQARLEGYFRIEWKLAAQRTHAMAEAKPFLLPVVIDATRDAEAHVPAEFRAVQWTRLVGGNGGEKFCARVKQLLGGAEAIGGARTAASEITSRASLGAKKRSPAVMVGSSLAVLVAILTAVWVAKKSDRPAATSVAAVVPSAGVPKAAWCCRLKISAPTRRPTRSSSTACTWT
jgi:hypothetical protein